MIDLRQENGLSKRKGPFIYANRMVMSRLDFGASWRGRSSQSLDPFVQQYGERRHGEPGRLDKALLFQRRQRCFDMLRDLHQLWLAVNESMISLDILE